MSAFRSSERTGDLPLLADSADIRKCREHSATVRDGEHRSVAGLSDRLLSGTGPGISLDTGRISALPTRSGPIRRRKPAVQDRERWRSAGLGLSGSDKARVESWRPLSMTGS